MSQDEILVIDDELQIQRLLQITLSANGYKVSLAVSGKEGLALAASRQPALIILDLGLPDFDGIEVLVRLKEWFNKPVIILSVRNAEEDIVSALDQGATDYLAKPFRTRELLARIRAAIKHFQGNSHSPVLSFGDLVINLAGHTVHKSDQLIKLTTTEFQLLSLLARNEGRVLTHQYILKEVWGMGHIEQTEYLRVFIAQLRKKIEQNPSQPDLIVTESGIGYRFSSSF